MLRELTEVKLHKAGLVRELAIYKDVGAKIDELSTAWGGVSPLLQSIANSVVYQEEQPYEEDPGQDEQLSSNVTGQFNSTVTGEHFEVSNGERGQVESKLKHSNNNDPLLSGQVGDIVPNIGVGIDLPDPDPALTMDETEQLVVSHAVVQAEEDEEPLMESAVTVADESFSRM